MLLIKNAEVFAPSPMGKKDILICGGEIQCIEDEIRISGLPCAVLDARGKYAVPGFMDQHVHITGGGGEGGFHTRTPEVQLSELIRGGITTVVGLLGTDGATRSMEDLYAKAMALNITYTAWAMLFAVVLSVFQGAVQLPSLLSVGCAVVVLVCGIFAAADFKEIFNKK